MLNQSSPTKDVRCTIFRQQAMAEEHNTPQAQWSPNWPEQQGVSELRRDNWIETTTENEEKAKNKNHRNSKITRGYTFKLNF